MNGDARQGAPGTEICAYCLEEDATGRDADLGGGDGPPICDWCASRTRNHVFQSFREKRQFIAGKRKTSRRAVLSWTEQELAEMGPAMASHIRTEMWEERRRKLNRLFSSGKTSRQILAEILEDFPELREEFAGPAQASPSSEAAFRA